MHAYSAPMLSFVMPLHVKPSSVSYAINAISRSTCFARRRWLEFHKINPKGHCEATHVCYTPYLWTPLWGLLAEAVARSATTNKKTSLRD